MSTISLRLPESIHQALRLLAKKESVSINQLITTATTEKVSALMTEDYLAERARKGSRTRFEAALGKVPNVGPDVADVLPARKARRR